MAETRAGIVRSPRLVGRDDELAVLLDAIDAARAGDGRAVFVTGEPGIGKSRLTDRVAESAGADGLRVLRGRARQSGTSSMRPFVEALLGLARDGWVPPSGLGPYLGVLGQLVPDWRSGGPAAATAEPFVHGEAILRVLKASREQASVLILEDLHDADLDTVAALEYLVDNVAGQAIAIIATVRDVTCPALDLAHYARQRDPGALLTLQRLGPEATAALGAALLGADGPPLPAGVCEVLFRDSVGNPLVATEMLREMVDGRSLVRDDDGWTVRDPQRAAPPRSLSRAVADRVRRSAPATRDLLRAAAVVGGEFPADVLGAAAGMPAALLPQVLDAAVREHFLVPAFQDGWFAFHHPMVEQAIRAQIPPVTRRSLALAAADAIERQFPQPSGEWCVRAGVLRESAGDEEGAGRLFVAGGRHAAAEGSPALAVDLLRRALAFLPPGDAERRAEVLAPLVTALGTLGRHQEALEHVDDVEALTEDGLPPHTVADLRIRLARVELRACRPGRVAPHTRAAREAIGGMPATGQHAELDAIDAYVALEIPTHDHASTAESLARRAIDTAREADLPAVECDALLTLGYRHGNHRPDDAIACYRRAYRIARTHDLSGYQLEALLLIGTHRWMWNADPSGLESAAAESSAAGAVVETRQLQLSLAVDALFRARFDDAEKLLDTAWDDIARLKLPGLGSYALAVRCLLHAHRGDDAALAAALAAFDAWRGAREDEVPLVQGLGRAVAALLQGDTASAREHLRPLGPTGEGDATKYYLCGQYGLGILLEVTHGTASWPEYEAVARRTAGGLPWNSQFLRLAHAVLAGRDGDAPAAESAVAEALAASAPFPLARHLGLHLVAPAAARDNWGDPARWLQEAEAYFTAGGVPAAAHHCRGLLRGLGEPVRQRRDGSDDVPHHLWLMGVTVREYEILTHIAERHTNREIASAFHISPRTVERHVANLLTKTGTENRRDLGALTTAGDGTDGG